MNYYKLSIAVIATANGCHAFTVYPHPTLPSKMLAASTVNDFNFQDDLPEEAGNRMLTEAFEAPKPVAPKKKPAPLKGPSHGQNGVLAPLVKTVKAVIGDDELNKVRGKAIALHSDVIKSFVDTSGTPVGQTVLKTLFTVADADKSGTLEENELNQALENLGFRFLNEKQKHGIFERADVDKNGHIDLDEWMAEAPKTLKTNLVKLAKKNGGDLGLLA